MRALTIAAQTLTEARNSMLGDGHCGENEIPAKPRLARLALLSDHRSR